MGRPNSGLKRHLQAIATALRRHPYLFDIDLELKRSYIYMYIYRQGWWAAKDAMTLKEMYFLDRSRYGGDPVAEQDGFYLIHYLVTQAG